ncbi:hypothetical protein P389DRAFT_100652 [Cystobasidium minutum MCA 4210]|uniref:uncharacterized protein n=1 Tax=Cystobasidium minutum MCA 4210 TaxID=1397322 RepID=UPI0034CD2EB7|eukprot:jgi/Rhomi1/100652/CE100651_356
MGVNMEAITPSTNNLPWQNTTASQQQYGDKHMTSLDGEPAFPTTPVLSLELENISKLSKGGREGLSYMWSVFSRCKESIRDGRRLENLSWRLWYEDLKCTGCVADNLPSCSSSASLSDPESECDTTDDDDEQHTYEDVDDEPDIVGRRSKTGRQGQSAEQKTGATVNSSKLSDVKSLEEGEEKHRPCGLASSSSSAMASGIDGSAERRSMQSQSSGKIDDGRELSIDVLEPTEEEKSRGRPAAQGREATSRKHDQIQKEGSPASQAAEFSNPRHAAPQHSRASTSASGAVSSPTASTSTNATTLPPSSPSKHIRRSSCPASRNRETLRISRLDGSEGGRDQQHTSQASGSTMAMTMTKKEKRALSFANTHRPTASHHAGGGGGRLARAMPPLTPETIQDIIGTVLPMDFKKSPRVRLASTSATLTSPPAVTTSNKPNSPSPTTLTSPTLVTPTNATQATPTSTTPSTATTVIAPALNRPAKVEHTREPSIKSERSYFTSTTATSELGVDPVFSPPLESPPITQGSQQQQQQLQPQQQQTLPELVAHETTTSAPTLQPTAATLETQNTSPRLTQSEDTRDLHNPSPDGIVEEEDEHVNTDQDGSRPRQASEAKSSVIAPSMKRNSSSHKVAVKPALLTRGSKNSASSSKLNRSALQRTQSAKSVRILESPTEADGTALEAAPVSTAANTAANAASTHQSHTKHAAAKHTSHGHSHVAPKRTLSSTRLKGHTRNGSSLSLHKEARTKSPTLPQEQERKASPRATAASSTTTAADPQEPVQALAAPLVERPEMQAAPHVTKAINIRRNNSSLANIIKTEPRSVSRGFAIPGHEQENREEEPDRLQSQHRAIPQSPSSPSDMAAASAAVAQSAPDAPALHPPPPSPASPVIMVPSSVILPPQPRPSPADPRFRVHSTIRRPRSPPLEEAEQEQKPAIMPHQQTARATVPRRAETSPLPANASEATAPRDMRPEPQQLTNAKKKQMFFFSSPGTDSDDEHSTSLKRVSMSAAMNIAPSSESKPASSTQRAAKTSESEKAAPAKPAIKVVQMTTPAEEQSQHGQKAADHSDDEDYEDEDDSEWSSEASESEEDEHQAAIRREEERQRLMFAKRTPSMVATQGGLLSKMLRPEEYSRGFANMPGHLRDNKSAMHLNQLPNIRGTAGIERARAANALLTVTGLQASKSTAALPDLKAAESSRLVPSKSGNHLTRLGGAPSGVELESDDDDDEDQPAQDISPSQQKKLAALMQRTTSSNGRPRTSGPVPPTTQHSPPRAEVSRVTSAAQIAMQPEAQPANIFTPRTTRRNMLATELTESLRASLLAERNKNRPAAGIGRLVSAVGSRLGVRPQQADSAPSQIEPPAVVQPPRIQRGSTGFTPANTNRADLPTRPGNTRASTARLPNTRANSDPPQQTEYYSPGFHHTGW